LTEQALQVKHLEQQIALFKELTASTDYEAAHQLLTQILPVIEEILSNVQLGLTDSSEVTGVIAQFSSFLASELVVLETDSKKISAEIRANFSSKLTYSEGVYRKQYGK
jgi:hypothetical protein